jgi:competence protein ComEC
VAPQIGQLVILTAHLSAPEGASAPDAFDFRRMAFFDGLGAVGYTRSPVLLWAEADAQAQLIPRLRAYLTASMLAHMPSQAGAFATGAMTGDRAAITQDTVQALRDSNLAHLLAISGMNLAFISGFVFMLIRYGVALAPMVALRVNAKKIAAVLALAVALFYWALSGANVSTTRAMVMIAVMLGAVLLDRRAISMRSVAIAGIVLLLITPEALLDPAFQLSFSATVVLVGAYGALDREIMRGRVPRWVMPLFALVLTSVLAGAATAPYAAAHFKRFTDYGLLANLLTVPVMSLLMAAGVMAALLAPFGAAAPALWVMEMSGAWILAVAHWVAGLDGVLMGDLRCQGDEL